MVAIYQNDETAETPVVLLEDIGAEIGLFVALGGVLAAHFTHEPRFDAAGSITIGVLLIVIAIFLAVEMKGLLMGEAALPDEQRRSAGAPSRSLTTHD
jgi:divalent metal cation (Fe/Co/Zn/Cd) transporter